MADYPNAITPPRTFFSIPRLETFEQLKQVDVAFLGVPFDAGASAPWTMAGQSAAPNAIRDVNPTLFHDISTVGLYDVDEGRTLLRGLKMMDCGDVNFAPGDSRINFQRIEAAAREIINQGTMLVGVGGDHSITYPLIRALDHYQDGEIDIINLDAHFDFFPDSMARKLPMELGAITLISWIILVTSTILVLALPSKRRSRRSKLPEWAGQPVVK
ncbi:arginase arginase family [Vibrio maritimus]|uniref:Arginase arginase family n=1 Tax=Vibrio maritimus TaxID=990268 RepID=A0A090T634_9VIBR|nr:arginase arginase family [Vibrio maritimus]